VGELKAAYDALNRELGLPTGPIDPEEYVGRFASELDVPKHVEARSREFVADGRERGLINGRNPSGFAATCLYAAAIEAGHDLTQREAADVAGVTPVTLRTAYYDLMKE
jgi:transcription initiation factor TFIIB